jgi:hypothetical protein
MDTTLIVAITLACAVGAIGVLIAYIYGER